MMLPFWRGREQFMERGTIGRRIALAAAAWLLLGAGNPPPEPGSTKEFREGLAAVNTAVMLSAGPMAFQQGTRAEWQATGREQMKKGYDLLRAGCGKDDAEACALLARDPDFAPFLPSPLSTTRQSLADKAVLLYRARCSESASSGFACSSYGSTLHKLVDNQAKFAADARLPRLAAMVAEGARVLAANCLVTGEACGDAEFLLAQGPEAPLKAFRNTLCDRGGDDACHAVGRKTSSELAYDNQAADRAKACEGGAAETCTLVAYQMWTTAGDDVAKLRQSVSYSRKACSGGHGLGCTLLGAALVDPRVGLDYPGAADAFGKACKLLSAKDGQQAACNNEKKIRAALAGKP
jgi:hypothetical protein